MANRDTFDRTGAYDAWIEVGKAFSKCQRHLAVRLRALGLSIAQHEVLVRIHDQAGITQTELSERLLVVKSNITGLMGKLEAAGLVERRVDRDDSRQKRLYLTGSGTDLVRRSFAVQSDVIARMAAPLTDDDSRRVAVLMRRVGETIDRMDEEWFGTSREPRD